MILALSLLASQLLADSASQTNWTEGPNHPGPYPSFSGRFLESDGIRWTYPGVLRLLDEYPDCIIDGEWDSPGNVICFDMNLDGLDDVIPISYGGSTLLWLENIDSAGTFEQHIIAEDYLYPNDAFPVDLDFDGDIDVVSCSNSYTVTAISWWENTDGAGTQWVEHVIQENRDWPLSLGADDIDGDGDIDVAVSEGFMDGDVMWYENVDGSGISWNQHTIVGTTQNNTNSICFADIDNDGDPDLFWVKYNANQVMWLENQLSGDSWSAHVIQYINKPRYIVAEDIDLDGYPDGVVVGQNSTRWYRNIGGGSSWSTHVIGNYGGIGTSVNTSDMDCDGDPDLLSSHYSGVIRCWLNSNDPFTPWPYRDLDRDFDEAYSVYAGDMNNDGYPDVVGASTGLNQVVWWNYHGFSYPAFGELTSSILSLGVDPVWESIDWEVNTPFETEMMVLVRSADHPDSLIYWTDTLLTPGSLSGILEDNTSLLQYKILLISQDRKATPVLESISFYWMTVGIQVRSHLLPEGIGLLPFFPNPVTGSISVELEFAAETKASIHIFDISGRKVFSIPVTLYEAGTHSVNAGIMEPGAYFCRVISEDCEFLRSFVVVE